MKIVCEDGWNDIAGWLPREAAKAPLDVDLLVQVLHLLDLGGDITRSN